MGMGRSFHHWGTRDGEAPQSGQVRAIHTAGRTLIIIIIIIIMRTSVGPLATVLP